MRFILAIDSRIARFEKWLLVIIVCFMVFAAFSQVVLRNFFNYSIEGADIFLRHLVLWIGFIGASLATRSEKHIAIDVLSRVSGPRLKKSFRFVTLLFAMTISLLLGWAGFLFVSSEHEFGTVLFGSVKAWNMEIIIPVGFLLIGLRFALNILLTLFPRAGEQTQ